MSKRLYRSKNKVFSGVLGGFAEYFDWDPTLTRVLFVVIALFTSGFPLLIAYIIAAIVMPESPSNYTKQSSDSSRNDVTPDDDEF
mgnify:CR=1 FL=1